MNKLFLKINMSKSDFAFSIDNEFNLSGITVVTGHSGSGKSTLLRCIAGLDKFCRGEVLYNSLCWQNSEKNIFVETHKRKIGFVFQENYLFSHLNVLQNIEYAQKRKHNKLSNENEKNIIQQIGVLDLLNKKVQELSGGEKQKVAIVRTLLNSPNLILMDEPLSSIDENAKLEIIQFLNWYKKYMNVPIIFVTHSENEKNLLADTLYIMNSGNLEKKQSDQKLNHNVEQVSQNNDFLLFKQYQKQIMIHEFGTYGQKKLKETKFLCIGAGGLGNTVCMYLAAAGACHIGIIDDDKVELSNLHRQVLYQHSDIGLSKCEQSKIKLKNMHSQLQVETFHTKLNALNGINIVNNYDVIIDCTDNFASNFLIADLSVKYKKPLVYASVSGFDGQFSVFWPEYGPCFRCLFKNYPENFSANCNSNGVLGPACGVIGSVQALQAIYASLGYEHCQKHKLEILVNKFVKFDLRSFEFSSFLVHKNQNCALCSNNSENIKIADYQFSCATNNENIEISFCDIENTNDYIFVDVRDELEYNFSHIEGAIHIPLSEIINDNFKNNFELNKTKPLIVYCQKNIRSEMAITHLKKNGFDNVVKLKDGYRL